ncbi:MAG: putative transcriptional regulator [halophilic archaeon J07HX5]|jgi:Predicted transcriptional regulators|nr:MAG: putative transcriptional regulator [halophilic archaeon J07HX5]
MNDRSNHDRAVEMLQQLGLKEYESKSFVALTRLSEATAKKISEDSEVPRTRVYDAVRVLETKGLVQIQHSNPQQFRAVSISEAATTLRSEYDTRVDKLEKALDGLESAEPGDPREITHEVWSLTGNSAITSRAQSLIDDTADELVLVIGRESAFPESTANRLRTAVGRGVDVIIGTPDPSLRETVSTAVPGAEVFRSELEWLDGSPTAGDDTEISRLLLADRAAILVSSAHTAGADRDEQAVLGRGFENGVVTIIRRLMATGLLPGADPGRTVVTALRSTPGDISRSWSEKYR